MARALLIVDVQNDFTEGGALGCEGGAAVAAAITDHVRATDYDLVVASRDWHHGDDDNGGHFAAGEPDFVDTWPVHCVAGTPGAEYHPAIDAGLVDVHVVKGQGRPAYSAFEGETDDGRTLASILDERGIDELVVVGIATDYCVKASALDGLPVVPTVTVVDGLTAAVAPGTRAAALTELADAGVVVR